MLSHQLDCTERVLQIHPRALTETPSSYYKNTRMRIDFLLVADAAEVVNGKLYMLGGGWDLFHSPVFPTVTRIGIAAGILFETQELDQIHRVVVRISEIGGRDLLSPLEAEIRPKPRPVKTEAARSIIALNPSLQIPGVGLYEVKVAIREWEHAVRFQTVLVDEQRTSAEKTQRKPTT